MVKAAVHKFCSLSPSKIENLELQLLAELCSLRGLYSVMDPARMNLMFWGECVAVSHRNGVDTVLRNHRLVYILEYMTQIRMFNVYFHLNK